MYTPDPRQLAFKVRYLRDVGDIPELEAAEAAALRRVARTYAFRANDYYLGLIDWDDPRDPIRRLVIPDPAELHGQAGLDPSDEAACTVAQGVQHKYADTALVLTTDVCPAYCRYCFRKRLFMRDNEEAVRDMGPAYEYVAGHREITDVLLTGGDPLVLSTGRLAAMVGRFADIDHVQTIRIGSKVPAFNPFRILDDGDLLEVLSDAVDGGTAVYVMTHFDHPRELTDEACEALGLLQGAGAQMANQCPLVRGVNDDPLVLQELFECMTQVGAPQYYLFQNRPTAGNQPYARTLTEAWRIFDQARRGCSGLSRRARFCMSHATGKIEVVGLDARHIYCRYHRAKDPALEGRMVVCRRDDGAWWFDDLVQLGRAASC
jgi:lysine 2,3-aminomutase